MGHAPEPNSPLLPSLAFAQNVKPVADRFAAQNALFDDYYETDLRNRPEMATAFGDYRYNDKLTDYSLQGIAAREKSNEKFLARIQAISADSFSDQDRLSHDLLIRVLYQRIFEAEHLGKEVGFYQDPVSEYGRLSSELFRAVRLVVDTGIHAKGCSRDQVVEFFRKSGAVDEPTIQSETDRYISWPTQALSYKLGQLKFRELRDRAEKELGPKFDIRKFHDEMVDGGTLPLDMLDARTNKWIAEQKAR